jgi:hypothetical protein
MGSAAIASVYWMYPNAAPLVHWMSFFAPIWIASGAMVIRLMREADCISIGDVIGGGIIGVAVCWFLQFIVLFLMFAL